MSKPSTMGAYLTAARLSQRVSIQRAAEETRIKKEYLMRMESDEFDFQAPAYVRGFMRTYARFLHVDEEPLLEEFDRRYAHAVDASQIVALERRARRVPREPRRLNRWALAAVVVVSSALLFAFVGLVTGPDTEATVDKQESDERPATSVPSPTDTAEATVTPEAATPSLGTATFEDGIELEVVALRADCWVDVNADGVDVFSDTILEGGSETFTAEDEMVVVLGFPDGVELILNGENIGTPGGVDPIKFRLPEDLDEISS